MTKVFAFDLFGTLVDLGSVSKVFSKVNVKIDNLKLFTEIWQLKQLQYAWLLNFTNRYEPFSELSIRALKFTTKNFGLNLSDEQISKLNEAKLNLDPFPDSEKGLQKLNEAIRRRRTTMRTGEEADVAETDKMRSIIVLSNGEADKSDKLLYNIGLRVYFDPIISAEAVRKYKPSPEPYLLVTNKLNLQISQIALVSSNLWDIAGAKSVGMHTCWINREDKKTNEEINIKPDYVFSSLEDMGDNLSVML
jgi:2-haloacid dehalogenase